MCKARDIRIGDNHLKVNVWTVKVLIYLLVLHSVKASDNEIKRRFGNYDHHCSEHGKYIKIGYNEQSWGHLVTPGFPTSIRTPLNCSWKLDYSNFSNDKQKRLMIYASQVYVQVEYLNISTCSDSNFTICSNPKPMQDLNIIDEPFVRISLILPSSPHIHLRVIEVHDVYGVNMTYEVADPRDRENWFHCSARKCHYNGRCIVKTRKDFMGLDSMKCVCNQPLVYSASAFYFGSFYGDGCQYNSKLGHCSGPQDAHHDSLARCNGHPCYYLTSRLVKCNCTEGFYGDSCEYAEQDSSVKLLSQPNAKSFSLKALLQRRIGNSEKKKVEDGITKELVQTACLQRFCSIQQFKWKYSSKHQELHIDFKTADATINQKLAEMTRIFVNGQWIELRARVKVIKMNVNKSNPVTNGEALVMTCQYSGSSNLSTSWYKDKLQVETTNPGKLKADERYIAENPVSHDGKVLHIENANEYDSGTFRCVVTDNNEVVAKDLDSGVLVSRPPELEVVPSALVLPQVGNKITADLQQSTIFCYIEGLLQDDRLYKFQWFKRGRDEDPSRNKEIRFNQGPEEIESIKLPVGSLLRLNKIDSSATYTCTASMDNTFSYLEVPVDVIAYSQINHKTCDQMFDSKEGYWPEAGLGTSVSIQCPSGSTGRMTRRCGKNGTAPLGYSGEWEPVDKDNCVRTKLMFAVKLLETFKSGYIDPLNKFGLWHNIVTTLWNETHNAQPRFKEWNMYLQILYDTLSYLKYLDRVDSTQVGWWWTKQVSTHQDDIIYFFQTIKHLLLHVPRFTQEYGRYRYSRIESSKFVDLLDTLRWHSLLIGRIQSSQNMTRTLSIPHCDVYVKKINLTQRENQTNLSMPEYLKNESINTFFHGVHVVLRWPSHTKFNGIHNIFIISVIILDQLKDNVHVKKQNLQQYALKSQLVTISMETKVMNKLDPVKQAYEPRDQITLEKDYMFIITFDEYAPNNSSNQSLFTNQSQLQCGRLIKHSLEMRNATTCRLEFTNKLLDASIKVPTCICPSAGTYGLLELLPSVPHSPVPEALPSLPVIYGCLTSMILSFLSWVILVKSCKRSPKKFYAVCKISTSFSVFISSLMFILQLNEVIPVTWTHTVSSVLQVTMLTGLSSQLGIAILLLAEYRALLSSRLSHVLLCLLSCLGPTLVVSILSAGCNNSYQYYREWWVLVGGYHFNSYISVLVILLMFLAAVLSFLSYILFYIHKDLDGADSMIAEHKAVLLRMIIVSGILILYNISSVLFVNWRDSFHLSDYLFSLVTVALGFAIMLCYILTSETYILVSCGEKSQDEWRDFKTNDVQMRGSRSDSGSSRLTTSSSVFQKYPKVNKKEPLQRVSDIEEVYEVHYEDPDCAFNSRLYPVSSIIMAKSSHQISAFGPVSSSPSRNPPPLPKRAKCFLMDNISPLPPPCHLPTSFSPSILSSVATSPNQPPLPPFPPVTTFIPPTIVSKEPEPLDIVIDRASKEQSGGGKMPLPSHIGGSGSMSTDLTTSSRRTTLSIATSLESEYVPPHGQNSPSPVIGRLTRARGLASSCEDDTDHEQDDYAQQEIGTLVLSGYRSGDNYTEMASPMSQCECIADMMARESSGLSATSTKVAEACESSSSAHNHKQVEVEGSEMYCGSFAGSMIPNRYSFDALHNIQTQDLHGKQHHHLIPLKQVIPGGGGISIPCKPVIPVIPGKPGGISRINPLAPASHQLENGLQHQISANLLSSHQLPDYLNADRGAILSALLASMNVKPKPGFCSNKLDTSTPSLSVNHLQDSTMSTNSVENAPIAGYKIENDCELKPIIRTTRALSTPSCTLVSSQSHSIIQHNHQLPLQQEQLNQKHLQSSSPSSSTSSESSTALSASSTRIFENILNIKPVALSSSAHNICTGRGKGVGGLACTPQHAHHLQPIEKKQILKKIQSASEMSSSGGLSDDSVNDQPRPRRFRLFPSEI